MKKSRNSSKTLSVVILNYNSTDVLWGCLHSLKRVREETKFEIIVIDNASIDAASANLREGELIDKLILNKKNLGFAKGNNIARKYVDAENVLFLNPDTVVHKGTLSGCVEFLTDKNDVGVVTCRQILPNGKLDPDSRRRFPNLSNSIMRLSGLARLVPKSRLVNSYWYGGEMEKATHEIDVAQGSFFMVKRRVLDEVGWFDKDYFLNGEDIDLSWKIKDKGYNIVYLGRYSIDHLKKVSKKRSLLVETAGVKAMEIFYRKRIWSEHTFITNYLVVIAIRKLLLFRILKFYLLG